MTAIYAYTLPDEGRAALVSDDREIVSGNKVDKVFVLGSRFGVAVYGVELTLNALGVIGHFEGREGYADADSIETFATQVSKVVRSLVEIVYPFYTKAYHDGDIPAQNWNAITQNPARFVVLDTRTLELADVDLGIVFPPGVDQSPPDVVTLASHRLHLFALARNAAGAKEEVFPREALDVSTFFSKRIESDFQRESAIGALGAMLAYEDGKVRITSTFSSYQECLVHGFSGRLKGFRIVVSCPGHSRTAAVP